MKKNKKDSEISISTDKFSKPVYLSITLKYLQTILTHSPMIYLSQIQLIEIIVSTMHVVLYTIEICSRFLQHFVISSFFPFVILCSDLVRGKTYKRKVSKQYYDAIYDKRGPIFIYSLQDM